MKILAERRLEDADEDRLVERVVYFPANGAVVRQIVNAKGVAVAKEVVIRLVYGSTELTNTILNMIQSKYEAEFSGP